jgi:thioesterase domain-containing protein
VLNLEGLPGADDDFFELGGNSLLAFTLFDRIYERFGTELPPSLLVQASTLRLLALSLDTAAFVEGRVVVQLHPSGSRLPCFYVQSGAGGILTLRNFATTFGPDQPLYGIQAFRDDDVEEGQILSVASTAAECLPIVRQRQPHGPYIIAGHSIGGHIAFELACLLEADGEEVRYLGLLDPPAPHTLKWRGRIAARALELTGMGPEPRRAGAIRTALSKVGRRLRASLGSATGEAQAKDADRPSQWMRNLAKKEKRYAPREFSGKAIIYRTVEMTRHTGSSSLGWDRYVRGPVESHRVPGGHVSLLLEPDVQVVAGRMDVDIRSAQADVAPEHVGV